MKRRHPLSLLLLPLLLLPLLLFGCGSGENAALSYVLSDEPVTLDPQIAEDTNAKIVIEALFEGLTRLDEDGSPYPGAAERWESNSSHTEYTFYLRENGCWSDGTPVTANDFVFAFQRALDPATGSTTCEVMYCIENGRAVNEGTVPVESLGVTALSDYVLQIRLEYENSDFPSLLSTTPFMPCNEAYFTETEGRYGLDSNCILGNGPFRMANRYSWEHDEYINLVRNETYVGEQEVLPASLTMTIGSDGTTSLSLLDDGTSDVVSLSYEESLTLDSNRYQVYTFHDTTWGICFNTQSDSLKSESVRKALLGALDRTSLLSYLPEGATATSRILPPTTTFNGEDYLSLSGGVTLTSQDTTALTQKEKSAVPTVTVLCLNDDASKRMANEMITAWNKRFDHYYNMEPLSEAELTSRIRSGDYEVAITALHAEGSEPLSLLSQFTSGSKNNPAALQSKEYDKLLAVTESSTSQTVLESCHSAEQYLIDHGVFYPLYEKPRCYATLSSLQGIVLHPYEQGIDFLSVTKG